MAYGSVGQGEHDFPSYRRGWRSDPNPSRSPALMRFFTVYSQIARKIPTVVSLYYGLAKISGEKTRPFNSLSKSRRAPSNHPNGGIVEIKLSRRLIVVQPGEMIVSGASSRAARRMAASCLDG
ncbi:hypothetical protein [Bradyrhizobium sp. STM 3562]|uniref:hypothetical protein n=1 Tax=Bradyrhizobium sp. STM 3562 TaxID=578924 RepID=UPI00389036A8